MQYMRKLRFLSLVLAVAATTSCETATNPVIATLHEPVRRTLGFPLVISPSAIRMTVGTSARLSVNVPIEFLSSVEWVSLNSTVATVDQEGIVTAFTPGFATIRARLTFDVTNVATALVEVVPVGVPVVPVVPVVIVP
jgi:hypothetical protein